MAKEDKVNHPSHYACQGGIECIDYITVAIIPYQGVVAGDLQNVLKYLWRADNKNGLEDLKKARWYAAHAMAQICRQQADMKLIDRAWRTAFAKRTPQEEALLRAAMAQCEGHLSEKEKEFYREIMSVILDGNLYQLTKGPERLVAALDKWISVYVKEAEIKKAKGGKKDAVG